MKRMSGMRMMRVLFVLGALPLAATMLAGCLVAGYSSSGGAFIWPGSFGLLVLLAILYFVLRSRR